MNFVLFEIFWLGPYHGQTKSQMQQGKCMPDFHSARSNDQKTTRKYCHVYVRIFPFSQSFVRVLTFPITTRQNRWYHTISPFNDY